MSQSKNTSAQTHTETDDEASAIYNDHQEAVDDLAASDDPTSIVFQAIKNIAEGDDAE